MEKISDSELMQIKLAKMTIASKQTEAEKAELLAKATELEFENLVLRLYLKYGLQPGVDQISEDGSILRVDPKVSE